ncbi:DUF2199 domain-containing protein [Paeniglutamicibacter sp.]|uniref:DUF2199 domain-containing protein n=1 Tax=Paeniglutamicibacter sp. TaxID=1934391 RepID=UPI003989F22A
MPAEHFCHSCGRDVGDHDRHIRFTLPDLVLESTEQHHAPGAWLSHEEPNRSVMMQIPRLGSFVRALLPVSLSHGHTLTFGVWVAISTSELHRTLSAWWAPEYADLRLTGYIANTVMPWSLLGAPVALEVTNIDHTPYCVSSPNQCLSDVLQQQWPHEILEGLPS